MTSSDQPTSTDSPVSGQANDKAPAVSASANTGNSTATQPGKKPGQPIAIASFVVALAAIAVCAYLYQQSLSDQSDQQALAVDLGVAVKRLDQQGQDSKAVQQQLLRLQSSNTQTQQQLLDQIETLRVQLSSQQKQLRAMSTTDRDDWLLAEVEYLIRLANQRLLMGQDLSGAASLLNSADEIVKELDDSALFAVRKALTEDIGALRAANKLDIEKLYLEIGSAAKQADRLRLFDDVQLAANGIERPAEQSWQQRFGSGLTAALEKLKGLVEYKKLDQEYKPVLAPEYEAAVRQNVRLMFEQAQMALLAGKQSLYNDSLAKARDWITNYYTVDQMARDSVLTMIDELQSKSIAVTVPDISSSLLALKDYIELRHQSPKVKATAEAVKVDSKPENNSNSESEQ